MKSQRFYDLKRLCQPLVFKNITEETNELTPLLTAWPNRGIGETIAFLNTLVVLPIEYAFATIESHHYKGPFHLNNYKTFSESLSLLYHGPVGTANVIRFLQLCDTCLKTGHGNTNTMFTNGRFKSTNQTNLGVPRAPRFAALVGLPRVSAHSDTIHTTVPTAESSAQKNAREGSSVQLNKGPKVRRYNAQQSSPLIYNEKNSLGYYHQ